MIPFMKPFIVANPVPEDLTFSSRYQEISRLPEFLSVQLTSPTGLDLVNVGDSEPQQQHRNKPWFKTSAALPSGETIGDKGIYVWNETTTKWENLSPVDAALLLQKIREEGVDVASDAETTAREAKADADRAKEFADNAQIEATAATANATAAQLAAEEAEAGGIQDTHFGIEENVLVPGTVGEFVGAWHDFTPWFDTSEPMVGFITLVSDSHPALPFRHGIEIRNDGTSEGGKWLRIVGYNMFAVPPGEERRVDFMWMIKGVPA